MDAEYPLIIVNTYRKFDRGFGSALRRNPASRLDKAGPENGGRQQDDRRAREANEFFFMHRKEAETDKIMNEGRARKIASCGCGFACLGPRKPAIDLVNALFEGCFWPPAESDQPA